MPKPKAPRVSPTDRRSWRAAAASPTAVNSARRQQRILVTGCGTLLAALLVAVLVIMLWPSPHLRIAGLVIDELPVFAAPPIAFAGEDLNALAELGNSSRSSFGPLGFKQATSFNSLPNKLAELAGSNDVAVIYVSAHGSVSRKGAPVILCSDYDPRKQSGQYLFTDLLESLKHCKAKTCLLVLDTGRLEVDIAGGVLINQFPDLVKTEVSKQGISPKLWVIVSNSFLEQSLVSYADRRSGFNYFFCEGLRGEADLPGNGDGNMHVELNELAKFLVGKVKNWAKDSTGGMLSQTPMILQGGNGEVKDPPAIYLARRQTPRKPAVEEGKTASHGSGSTGTLTAVATSLLTPAALLVQQASPEGAPAIPPQQPTPAPAQQPGQTDGAPTPADGTPASQPAGEAKAAAGTATPSAAGAPSKPEQPAGAPATPGQEGAASKAPSGSDPKATSTAPTSESADAAGDVKVDPLAEMRRRATDYRKRAETIDERRTPADWTPSDFAPHLWRAYGEQIAVCEARLDAGANFADVEATKRTNLLFGELDKCWSRIQSRQAEFFDPTSGRARASYDRTPGVRAAIQARNALLTRLPRYVRYYTSTTAHSGAGDLGKQLRDACSDLQTFRDILEQTSAEPAEMPDGADQDAWRRKVTPWLSQVEATGIKLVKHDRELSQFIGNVAVDVIERSKGRANRRAAETRQLRTLIESQLLTGSARQDAILALRRLETPIAKVAPWGGTLEPNDAWERAADRAELELQLVALVMNKAASDPVSLSRRAPTTTNDLKTRCKDYADLGANLADDYAKLPKRILDNLQRPAFPELRRAELQVHLVQGCDAADVDDMLRQRNPVASLGVPTLAPQTSLTVVPQNIDSSTGGVPRFNLDEPNKFKELVIAVHGMPRLADELKVLLTFKEKLLAVSNQQGSPVRSDREFTLRPTSSDAAELTLQVKAITATGEPTPLTARFSDGQRSVESQVLVAIPEATHIELVVEAAPKTWSPPTSTRLAHVQRGALRPFPNAWAEGKPRGGTPYRIWVRDSGGRARTLKYRLALLPNEMSDRAATAGFPWGASKQLPLDLVNLVDEQELKIEPNKMLPLPLAKAPAPNAPPPSPPTPAPAGATPPPAEPGTPIEGGLVAIFADPAAGTEEWIWLEVDVLHPDDYLSEPVVSYDRERINISVSAQDPQGLPARGSEIFMQIATEYSKRKVNRGAITPDQPNRAANLYAEVASQRDLVVPIALDVDGYPRAFIYDVPCTGGTPSILRKVRTLQDVVIIAPDRDLFGAIPSLHVLLRVDFPPRDETPKAYGCSLLANGTQVAKFHHDRRRRIWMLKPQAAGEFTLQTAVDDLQADLATTGFQNDEITIGAEILTADSNGNNEQVVADDSRIVRIDTLPPAVQSVDGGELEFRGEQEQLLKVRFRVTDSGSPVTKVEVAYVTEDGALKEPVRAARVGPDEYEVAMPTAGKIAAEHDLWAQATDEAENVSAPIRLLARIVPPPPPGPNNKPRSKNNSISGSLMVGEQGANGIKITLTGPKKASSASGANGVFEITDLPPGAYKLSAKGYYKNREYSAGPVDLTVEPSPAAPTDAGQIPTKLIRSGKLFALQLRRLGSLVKSWGWRRES